MKPKPEAPVTTTTARTTIAEVEEEEEIYDEGSMSPPAIVTSKDVVLFTV